MLLKLLEVFEFQKIDKSTEKCFWGILCNDINCK